jgi:hypothetical protein
VEGQLYFDQFYHPFSPRHMTVSDDYLFLNDGQRCLKGYELKADGGMPAEVF